MEWWKAWADKMHPVRAILALSSLGITAYMLISGISVPDAWWVITTGLALFYVESFKAPSA